jgi:hypothetical protein
VLSEKSFSTLITPVLEDYAYGYFVHKDAGDIVVSHPGGIAGFRSEVEAHMADGFGAVFLTNGGMDAGLQKWIVQSVTAAFHGAEPPKLVTSGVDTSGVRADRPHPQDYAGTYQLSPGDVAAPSMVQLLDVGGRLVLKIDQRTVPLDQMAPDTFRAGSADADGAYFFGRLKDGDSEVIEFSHGAHVYLRNGSTAAPPPVLPKEYAAFIGHFENNGPEGPTARVFVRGGRLMMMRDLPSGASEQLEPLGGGIFREGSPDYTPERARFDSIVAGRALRLTLSGVPLYRKDTP